MICLNAKDMVSGQGFEPRLTGSEPAVLPIGRTGSNFNIKLVRDMGVEPTLPKKPEPKSGASTKISPIPHN